MIAILERISLTADLTMVNCIGVENINNHFLLYFRSIRLLLGCLKT